jgi:hypothetical protein
MHVHLHIQRPCVLAGPGMPLGPVRLSAAGRAPGEAVDQFVDARLARQRIFDRPNPPNF